jgi:hypothetical protein
VIAPDGEAFVWQVRPNLVIERGSGLLTLTLAHCYTDYLTELLQPGMKCSIFGDFEHLTYYTREAREHLSAVSLEHLDLLDVVHFLISSKFVALGLSTYREDIGAAHFRVYTDRESFLRSFDAALHAPA